MATNTSRLSLTKPSSSENAEVSVLNSNFDTIDQNAGARICTSTTRPSQPFIGQIIFETDVELVRMWTGSRWTIVSTCDKPISIAYRRNTATQTFASGEENKVSWLNSLADTSRGFITYSSNDREFTIKEPGLYDVVFWMAWTPVSSSSNSILFGITDNGSPDYSNSLMRTWMQGSTNWVSGVASKKVGVSSSDVKVSAVVTPAVNVSIETNSSRLNSISITRVG